MLGPATADAGLKSVAADSPFSAARRQPTPRAGPLRRKPKHLDADPRCSTRPRRWRRSVVRAGGAQARPARTPLAAAAPAGTTDEPASCSPSRRPTPTRSRRDRPGPADRRAPGGAPAPPRHRGSARHRRARQRAVPGRLRRHRPRRARSGGSRRAAGARGRRHHRARPGPDPRRAVLLAVDVSGSMRGERVSTAAAAVGALAGELARDDLVVIAFWSDAALLAAAGPSRVVHCGCWTRCCDPGARSDQRRLPAARRRAASWPAVPDPDARVLLLSDCVHNAGPDPPLGCGRARPPGRAARHRRANRTTNLPASSPGSAAAGWPASAATATSRPPSRSCSRHDSPPTRVETHRGPAR